MPKFVCFCVFIIFILNSMSYSFSASDADLMSYDLLTSLQNTKHGIGISFIDLKSGIHVGINNKYKFRAASVIKVPIMAAVYKMADENKLNLNTKLTYNACDKLKGSGILQWQKPGKSYTIRNLVGLMISYSDNIATKMLIDYLGLPEIKKQLASFEAHNTVVVDDTCLNEDPSPDMNLTTPDDISHLLKLIYGSNIFSKQSRHEMMSALLKQKYTFGIPRGVPKGIVVANKTGNIDFVLNDAGIVFSPNGEFILAIFTYGYPKKRDARVLINKITEIVYKSVDPKADYSKNEPRKEIKKKPIKKKKVLKFKKAKRHKKALKHYPKHKKKSRY